MAAAHLDEKTTKDVLRQVEFYFSDSNLPRDKFLTGAINESEDGLVSLALICSFSRMRSHLGLGSVKANEIPEGTVLSVAEVLKKSTLLKISDDGKKVGRLTALLKPEEVIEQVDSRTIAASPLEYDVVMDDVQTYFSQYGKVNSVRLPRHIADTRCFSGTALVEFSTEEDAKNVLGQHLVYTGAELELKPKKEYDSEREKLLDQVRSSQESNKKEDSSMDDWYPKGLIIAFQLKTLSSKTDESNGACHQSNGDVAHQEHVAPTSAGEDNGNADNSLEDGCKEDAVNLSKQEETEVAGTDNLENDKNSAGDAAACTQKGDAIMREDLKEVFQKFGTVKFVDYRMGEESGYIRFEVPEAGQKARAFAVMADEGGLTVKGHIVTLEPVTGDTEKEYWSLLRSNQDRNKSSHGRGGRHNNRGRRQSNGKRNWDKISDSMEERPDKAQKACI